MYIEGIAYLIIGLITLIFIVLSVVFMALLMLAGISFFWGMI